MNGIDGDVAAFPASPCLLLLRLYRSEGLGLPRKRPRKKPWQRPQPLARATRSDAQW